jgi:hypothetical protein
MSIVTMYIDVGRVVSTVTRGLVGIYGEVCLAYSRAAVAPGIAATHGSRRHRLTVSYPVVGIEAGLEEPDYRIDVARPTKYL